MDVHVGRHGGGGGGGYDGGGLVVWWGGGAGHVLGGILRGLLLGGDDGLQVLALPALLAAGAVRSLRDLLGLVDGRLLDVGAIHRGRARLALGGERRAARGCGCGACAIRRSGRVGQRSSAGGGRLRVL